MGMFCRFLLVLYKFDGHKPSSSPFLLQESATIYVAFLEGERMGLLLCVSTGEEPGEICGCFISGFL